MILDHHAEVGYSWPCCAKHAKPMGVRGVIPRSYGARLQDSLLSGAGTRRACPRPGHRSQHGARHEEVAIDLRARRPTPVARRERERWTR